MRQFITVAGLAAAFAWTSCAAPPATGGVPAPSMRHEGAVVAVAFSPDGRTLATAGDDGTVRLWDVGTGGEVWRAGDFDRGRIRLAVSPDGRRLAAAGRHQAIRLLDAATGAEVHRLQGPEVSLDGMAFSPDGTRLASGWGGQSQGTLRIWDVSTGREILAVGGLERTPQSIAYSPDGATIAWSGRCNGRVRLCETATGREIGAIKAPAESFFWAVWAPGRERVAFLAPAEHDVLIHVVDAQSGKPVSAVPMPFPHGLLWRTAAFSPDGKRLAAIVAPRLHAPRDADDAIDLYDANSGRALQHLRGHRGRVMAVALSPDGGLLASGGEDRTVRLWDASSGREIPR